MSDRWMKYGVVFGVIVSVALAVACGGGGGGGGGGVSSTTLGDAETVATGLTAAETGHLVFGTLHAATAPQTISRLLDLFPGDKQLQMRKSLVFNLRAVICQKLLRCFRKERRRVPACEVMICTAPIRKLIDDAEDHKIHDVIRQSREAGMIDFTHSIQALVRDQLVTKREALANAPNANLLQSLFDGLEIA